MTSHPTITVRVTASDDFGTIEVVEQVDATLPPSPMRDALYEAAKSAVDRAQALINHHVEITPGNETPEATTPEIDRDRLGAPISVGDRIEWQGQTPRLSPDGGFTTRFHQGEILEIWRESRMLLVSLEPTGATVNVSLLKARKLGR